MKKNNQQSTKWQTKKLGEVLEYEQPSLYIVGSKNYKDDYETPVLTAGKSFILGKTKEKNGIFPKDKLPVIIFDDFTTATKFVDFPFKVKSSAMKILHPVKKISDAKFLFYLIQNISFDHTGIHKRYWISEYSKIEIFLPPLPEQHRIVKILDEVFADVAKAKKNAKQNLQNAKDLLESYLQSVFANPGKDWEGKRLGDIGKVSMCKRIFKEQTLTVGDIPFYKIGTFGKRPNAYISNKIYNEYRNKFSFPKKGDILLSASGTIGRRVKYDGEPAYFQDSNIVWIDNDEKQLLNEYLYHFYGACKWNATKGATIPRLYNDNLKRIEITFPKSISEQKSIVTKLDALSAETKKLEAIYKKKLADLEELKKSVLKKAFNGDL